MPFFVYLLKCRGKTLYCGWTNDLEKRLRAHNAGKGGRYTRSRRPVKLAYSARLKSRSAAMSMEAEIKSWPRGKKLALVKERA
ncbi:MAG: GIY-YIG nuclease family protein [Candidatus Diapherotrites archaeon]